MIGINFGELETQVGRRSTVSKNRFGEHPKSQPLEPFEGAAANSEEPAPPAGGRCPARRNRLFDPRRVDFDLSAGGRVPGGAGKDPCPRFSRGLSHSTCTKSPRSKNEVGLGFQGL